MKSILIGALCAVFAANVHADEAFYLKHNIWFYKKVSASTNYATDTLVPAGSKVTLVDEDSDELELKSEAAGTVFTVKLIKKHTKDLNIEEIKNRLLSKEAVKTTGFGNEVDAGIKEGVVVPGMSKEQVLLARGYPPKIGTESLEENNWTYWQNKWNRKIVRFVDGKVESIKD